MLKAEYSEQSNDRSHFPGDKCLIPDRNDRVLMVETEPSHATKGEYEVNRTHVYIVDTKMFIDL